jgi:radical SAM protein with 4Fe4S-binding SPASM domain
MNNNPLTAVWEVTMGCNMRCGHCGSSCEEPLPDQLSTEEALFLADEIAGLGLKWITLSGGEPLIRKDLPQIIKKLSSQSVAVNIITNGWTLDKELASTLKENGISTVAISIDGTKDIHDSIRKEGSFERAQKAFKYLTEEKITTGAVTTISRKNIAILPELREMLINMGVKSWQIQIGLPMGNFKNQPDWVISPQQIDDIIDFSYETSIQGKIIIYPADCIGYYTEKEIRIRQSSYKTNDVSLWDGCNAGLRGFGILHNGDILGCTSIRDKKYIEGNIREKRLADIWNNPEGFAWRRKMTKKDLHGDCLICIYGSKCLGGCPNTRLTMNSEINSENLYCSYNVAMKKLKEDLKEKTDTDQLLVMSKENLKTGNFQTAAFLIDRLLVIQPDNTEALDIKGFVEYMCGNYLQSEEANRKVLGLNPNNTYAMKGLGVTLHKQGNSKQGLEYLEQAAKLTGYSDKDIMNDLAVVKRDLNLF